MKLVAGFGKASIAETIVRDKKRIADALEVLVFATINSKSETAVILCSDLGGPEHTKIIKIRDGMAKALKLKSENITCNTTQNHSVPASNCIDFKKLLKAYIGAAKIAIDNIQPVSAAFISLKPENIHFNRRPHFGKYGAFTTWFGVRRTKVDGPDISHIAKNFLNSLKNGNPRQIRGFVPETILKDSYIVPSVDKVNVPEPFLLLRPEDSLLQSVFFKDAFGEPLGSIIRFAAHPAMANIMNAGYYSHDYPGYVRARAEERWGGISMFLTGPTGDQVGFTEKKSLEFAAQYGSLLADLALDSLPGSAWVEDGEINSGSSDVELTIRKDLPETPKEAKREMAILEKKIIELAFKGVDVSVIKKLSDRHDTVRFLLLCFKDWSGYDIYNLRGKKVKHPLFALKFGPLSFLSLPSEPFGAFSKLLRDKTNGDQLITFEEGNGYTCYIPTTKEHKYGNYEINANFYSKKLEKELLAGSLKILKKVNRQ